jgi:hypothetical protein
VTCDELRMVADLARCTFPVATNQKRFAKNMIAIAMRDATIEITPKQSAYLKLLHHRFRRQHGSAECVTGPRVNQ